MADRFAARLAAEVEAWVREGLVTAQQASRIVARYPTTAAWFTRPITLFSMVGGALVAAGIALVVAHNWADIHRWAKLIGVVTLTLGAHAGGLALRERDRRHLGEGVLLLGGALLLVGIALVGQIYHLTGRASDTALLWWALLMPAAYVLPSPALIALAWTGTAGWFLLSLIDATTLFGHAVNERELLSAVAVSAFGLVLFALGIAHGREAYRRVGRFLELLGLLGLIGGLLALGLGWHGSPRVAGLIGAAGPVLGLLVVAALAVVLAAARLPAESKSARTGFVVMLLTCLLLLAAFAVADRTGERAQAGLIYASWAVLFALALGLILGGARWGRPSWLNAGLVAILVQAVWRYVELLGGLLGTSALFLSTGVFVLLLGWGLERLRRQMTREALTRATAR